MKRLKSLDVDEVSLVDIGANKKKFLVFKSKCGSKNMKIDLRKVAKSLLAKADEKAPEKEEANGKEKETEKCDTQKAEGDMAPTPESAVHKLSERAEAALKAVGRILTPVKDEISDEEVDKVLKEIGMKFPHAEGEQAEKAEGEQAEKAEGEEKPESDAAVPGVHKEAEEGKDEELKKLFAIPETVKEEHAVEALKVAKEAMSGHLEKLGYRQAPDAQPAMKAKEEEGKDEKEVEKIFKAHKDLVKKNADLEAKIKDMEKAEVQKELVQKAASFKNISLKQEDVIEVLSSAKELGEKHYEKVCKQYEAMDAQIAKGGLFSTLGTTASNEGAASAEAKISAAVNEIVKKAGNVTKEQAEAEFLQTAEGKALYGEMKSHRPYGI